MHAHEELRTIMLEIGKLTQRAAAILAAGGGATPAVTQRAEAARVALAQGNLFGAPMPMAAVTQKLGASRPQTARQAKRAVFYLHVWNRVQPNQDRIWRVTSEDIDVAHRIEVLANTTGGSSRHLKSRELAALIDERRSMALQGSTHYVGTTEVDDLTDPTPATIALPWSSQ